MKLKIVPQIIRIIILLFPLGAVSQKKVELLFAESNNKQNADTLIFMEVSQNRIRDVFKEHTTISPWFLSAFNLTVGLFIPVNNTKIEVGNRDDSFGTTIDFEDDLGFRKYTSTFLLDLQGNISKRSRLNISYFYLNRNTSYQLKKDVEFGDHIYPVNANVSSFFKTNIYRLYYGYAFFVQPKYEIGIMIGAHIIGSEVGLGLKGDTVEIGYNDNFNFTAPLPDIGFWAGYAITDKFAMNGNISYFSLKINDINGKLTSYNFSLIYRFFPSLNFELSYTGLNFLVDVEQKKLQGYFKWGYNGPSVSISYAFSKTKRY